MANKKISELNYANADQIEPTDVLTFVDVDETAVENINKNVTFDEFGKYLKEYTNLFPIPFNSQFIEPDAYVNGVKTPIASKVAGQTVNLADVAAFKFDEYGRVIDYTSDTQPQASEEILMASGSAATWYKTRITENFNTPQPASIVDNAVGVGSSNAGYFNQYSFWNPKVGSGAASNAQKINYSDGRQNDYDWTYLFDKNYENVVTTKIEMSQTNDNSLPRLYKSDYTLYIYWSTGKVIGSGIVAGNENYNYSVVFNDSIVQGEKTIVGIMNQATVKVVENPKIIIDGKNKKILGLPIGTVIKTRNNTYLNNNVNVSLILTNYF
jgi:hypothetical protein